MVATILSALWQHLEDEQGMNWNVSSILGAGAFGTVSAGVYKPKNGGPKVDCAVKVLKPMDELPTQKVLNNTGRLRTNDTLPFIALWQLILSQLIISYMITNLSKHLIMGLSTLSLSNHKIDLKKNNLTLLIPYIFCSFVCLYIKILQMKLFKRQICNNS